MELLRIIAMLMILIIHSDFLAIGAPTESEFHNSPAGAFFRTFWELAGVIGVNIFVMISGFFGIRFSIRRTVNFIFQIFYWLLIVGILLIVLNNKFHFLGASFSLGDLTTFPTAYWFVKEYLVLMVLSMPLNAFLDHTDKSAQQKFLLCYLALAVAGSFYAGVDVFSKGYSAISFVGIYVLGGYIRRNLSDFTRSPRYYIIWYLIVTAAISAAYIATKFLIPVSENVSIKIINMSMCYTGPVNILSASLLIIAFAKMSFHSKTVNYVAASAFGVYLFHCHSLVLGKYLSWCRDLHADYSGISYIGMLILTYAAIFALVIVADQGRKFIMKASVFKGKPKAKITSGI